MNLDMMISEFSQQLALISVRACSRFLELFQQEEPSSIGYLEVERLFLQEQSQTKLKP